MDCRRGATSCNSLHGRCASRRAAKRKRVSEAEGQGAAGYRNGAKNDGSSCMPENPLGLGRDEECWPEKRDREGERSQPAARRRGDISDHEVWLRLFWTSVPRLDGNERKLLCAVELPIEPLGVTRRDEIDNSFYFANPIYLETLRINPASRWNPI